MYIVLIALAYIWIMMVATASSPLKGTVVFVLGAGLLYLIYYLLDTPGRRRRRIKDDSGIFADQQLRRPDGADTRRDQ